MTNLIWRSLFCTTVGMWVQGCATPPMEGRALVPPSGVTNDQISTHISQCIGEARSAEMAPLSDQERAPLQNRSTVEFIVRGMPVVNAANGWPALYSGSLSTTLVPSTYGPAAVSDRYVLCLLKRGYRWPITPARS